MGNAYEDILDNLSEDHVYLIDLATKGCGDPFLFRVLSSMSKDRYARGIVIRQDIIDALLDNLEEVLTANPMGVDQCFDVFDIRPPDHGGFRAKRGKLAAHGFVSRSDIRKAYTRAWLQTKIILGEEDPTKGWETADWPQRLFVFERSLKRYAETLRRINLDDDDFKVDRVDLSVRMTNMGPKKLCSLSFQEEKFWHPDTQSQSDEGVRNLPIRSIMNAIVKMELPPINDERWFHFETTEPGFESGSEADEL